MNSSDFEREQRARYERLFERPRRSGFAVASFFTGIVACLVEIAALLAAGIVYSAAQKSGHTNPAAMATPHFFMVCGLALSLVGLVLGGIALAQQKPGRMLARVGVFLNLLVIALMAVLLAVDLTRH
jgi:hypothetical protein